jgi:hypothetical protein
MMATQSDAVEKNDDWIAALINMGIEEQLFQGIMNSDYRDVRLTETAGDWVIDPFDDSFFSPSTLSDRIERKRAGITPAESSAERGPPGLASPRDPSRLSFPM